MTTVRIRICLECGSTNTVVKAKGIACRSCGMQRILRSVPSSD